MQIIFNSKILNVCQPMVCIPFHILNIVELVQGRLRNIFGGMWWSILFSLISCGPDCSLTLILSWYGVNEELLQWLSGLASLFCRPTRHQKQTTDCCQIWRWDLAPYSVTDSFFRNIKHYLHNIQTMGHSQNGSLLKVGEHANIHSTDCEERRQSLSWETEWMHMWLGRQRRTAV